MDTLTPALADDPLYGEDPGDYIPGIPGDLDPAEGEAVDYLLSECPHGIPLYDGCYQCQK
jgi:hypothetical protein